MMKKIPYYNGEKNLLGAFSSIAQINREADFLGTSISLTDEAYYDHRETRPLNGTDLSLRTTYAYAVTSIFEGCRKGGRAHW